MKIFDLQTIQEMEQEELLDETIKTIFDIKPIILKLKEMNELVYELPEKADFGKITQLIVYQDKANELIFEINVPVYDERKLPEFQVNLFDDSKNDCFPERGFYIVGDSKLIIEPLGLVKLEMNGLAYTRISSDYRYTRASYDKEKGYKEYLYFYFNYETNQFIKVYSDKLEECKRNMQKKPKAVYDYHETVQEYINREALLAKIKERIYPLSLPYLLRLKEWKNGTYGKGGLTIGAISTYFDNYKRFIEEDMVKNLKIKLVYANVTKSEYSKLLEKKRKLSKLIQMAYRELEEIKAMHSLTEKEANNYKLDANSFFEREIEIYNHIEHTVMLELRNFQEVRPTEFPKIGLNKGVVLKGYIDYDLKKNEVYPNIIQLQRRNSLTEEKEDFRSEEEYVANILGWLANEQA